MVRPIDNRACDILETTATPLSLTYGQLHSYLSNKNSTIQLCSRLCQHSQPKSSAEVSNHGRRRARLPPSSGPLQQVRRDDRYVKPSSQDIAPRDPKRSTTNSLSLFSRPRQNPPNSAILFPFPSLVPAPNKPPAIKHKHLVSTEIQSRSGPQMSPDREIRRAFPRRGDGGGCQGYGSGVACLRRGQTAWLCYVSVAGYVDLSRCGGRVEV